MIEVDYKTHPELYTDYKKSVEYCKNIEDRIDRQAHFHVQWIGSEIGRMQSVSIKAFLTSQNESSRLTVWTDRKSDNEWTEPLKDKVDFKVFDAKRETIHTPFQGKNLNYWQTDIMRMVYLSKYGGVHIDMDTVLLRDLSPFLDQEFFYTWGIIVDEIAGGVIHLRKNSEVNNAICQAIIEGTHGLYRELFSYIREKHHFWVFPCAWFNTEWMINTNQIEDDEHFQFIRCAMNKNAYANEFYEGVFSWHWHNCWQMNIEEGSKWELMERYINRKFEEKYG